MKLFRSVWIGLLNLVLILLPWVVLGFLGVQFGQPLLAQFKDFLGDPVSEVLSLSRRIQQNPDDRILFDPLHRHFEQVGGRKTLSDTETRSLRRAVVAVHHQAARRLETGDARARYRTFGDSYVRLLETRLVERVFSQPTEVKRRLTRDLERVVDLSSLPYHQARGLPAFIQASDSAAEMIQTYGQLYADPHICRSVFQLECGQIYGTSADIVASSITRYLERWPNFGDNEPARPGAMLQFFRPLKHTYRTLIEKVSGYFEAPPWNEHPRLNQVHLEFRNRFERNVRRWYTRVVEQFEISPESFLATSDTSPSGKIGSLLELERHIQTDQFSSKLILSEETRTRREQLLDQLFHTYQWVGVNSRLDPEMDVRSEALQVLKRTLRSFPEAAERYEQQTQLIEEIDSTHQSLTGMIRRKQYGALVEKLNQLSQRLGPEDPIGWSLLLQRFLDQTASTITRPEWQPSSGAGQREYTRLVELYGRVGKRLQIPQLSREWANSTIVSLKSRRYNRLQHQIRSLLAPGEQYDRSRLATHLQELMNLTNLPEPLASRQNTVVFHALLIDRIHHSDDRLFQNFSSIVEGQSEWTARRDELNTLMKTIEEVSAPNVLQDVDLPRYVGRLESWLEAFSENDPLVSLLRTHLYRKLKGFLRSLVGSYRDWIARRTSQYPPLDWLFSTYSNLREGIRRANEISDFSMPVNLEVWHNLLEFRRHLQSLQSTVQEMDKGSLLGSNPEFEQFRSRIESFKPRPFPENYEPAVEVKVLRELHDTVLGKAKAIHRASQGDWIGSWGGRIRGGDILELWLKHLSRLHQQPDREPLANTLTDLIAETRRQKRILEG